MAVPAVLEPLIAAGLTAKLPDGYLYVAPKALITPEIDAFIRTHRDELVVDLSAPLDWPPPEPPWFAEWMAQDDRRRAETMVAGVAFSRRRRRCKLVTTLSKTGDD